MPSLWKFGGLTPILLAQRSFKKLGEDELSTRSAALSYYFILALFPMLLFIVSLIGLFAGPHSELRETIFTALGELAPGSASVKPGLGGSKSLPSSGSPFLWPS